MVQLTIQSHKHSKCSNSGQRQRCRTGQLRPKKVVLVPLQHWHRTRFSRRSCGSENQFRGGFSGDSYGRSYSWDGDSWSKTDPMELWRDMIQLQEDLRDVLGGFRDKRAYRKTSQDGICELAADFEDTGQYYVIYADIPGLKKENIKVQLGLDNQLVISGERVKSSEKPSERFFGKFSRSFKLPDDADVENIIAAVQDGTLQVNIKKIISVSEADEKKRDIPIV